MIDKRVAGLREALAGVRDGATVLISGFGEAGNPTELVHALIEQGARDLTIVSNNAGNGHVGIAALMEAGRVAKVICSFPRSSDPVVFETLYRSGRIQLECVPQGTLAERIRAAGAGIGGFYTRTAVGTDLAAGKETRDIDGETYVLEAPIRADLALVKAESADRWGNVLYNKAARNFGPIMCMAASLTVVQVRRMVALGELDPERIVTPGIFVDRVVEVPNPVSEREAAEGGRRP